MNQQQGQQTETGINISGFSAKLVQGHITIQRMGRDSENYLWVETTWIVIPNPAGGAPQVVEAAPQIRNINRASLDSVEVELARQEAMIAGARTEVAAIRAAMDAADAKI